MMWASRVPAVIDRLAAVFKNAPGLEGVVVRDGPVIGSQSVKELLSVGWTGLESETDVDVTVNAEGLAPPDREHVIIRCAAAVLSGSTEVGPARQRAYELLAAASEAIAVDRTLGGLVLRAMVGSHSLIHQQLDRGLQAVVIFAVEADAYTAR